jgi:hypothetical protein
MLSHKEVLPNRYFKKALKFFFFEKYNLHVPITTENFVPQDTQRGLIASVLSFIIGGLMLIISL